jgi:hypothetical protein
LPTLVGDILADEIGGKTVHRAVAGRIDDKIGRQLRPVVEPDASLGDLLDLAALELDLAVDDKLARADVDVIARAVPQVFHEQPRVVGAPIMPEARPFEAGVELRLTLLDLLIERDLELVQDAIGDRGEDEIGAMVIDARLDHLLGVERAEANVRQRVRAHDVGRGALDHCHVGVVLPQRRGESACPSPAVALDEGARLSTPVRRFRGSRQIDPAETFAPRRTMAPGSPSTGAPHRFGRASH